MAWAFVVLLPLAGVCYAAEAPEPKALSESTIIGAMSVAIAGLLALWLRSLNKDVALAQKTADEAKVKAATVELSLLSNYETSIKFARQIDLMLQPIKDKLDNQHRDMDYIKRMLQVPGGRVDPNPPDTY